MAVQAQEPRQPIWQPAIYCAALDLTRAEILADPPGPVSPRAGTEAEAARSAATYMRLAREDMGCPAEDRIDTLIELARVGISHRLDLAASYGIGREITVMALASEAELVCALQFDPDLIAAARRAVLADPVAPCGADPDTE